MSADGKGRTRLIVAGTIIDREVICESFTIDGCDDEFAAHESIDADRDNHRWTATHVETGFAVGRGDTIEDAIKTARERWTSKTPEEIAAAKARAYKIKAARDTDALFGESES